MSDLNRERFIIVPDDLLDPHQNMIVLSDYNFWAERTDELDLWCRERNLSRQGMVVVLPNNQSVTEFVLRWS